MRRERTEMAVGLVTMILLLVMSLGARWLAPQDPYDSAQMDLMDGNLPPASLRESGGHYWLGTDEQGRDIFSAVLFGLRVSLALGAGSALVAMVIGTAVGVTAAYWPRRVGAFSMRIVDLQLAFPSILVALMIVAFFGKGVTNLLLALIVAEWAWYARSMRAAALAETQREYIVAARGLGLHPLRILLWHVLPNCMPTLMVLTSMQIGRAIALEATLSFLGLGVPVTKPSLGLLIANGYQYMMSGEYWISLFPGFVLLIAMIALNLVGEGLRERYNPRRLA